MSDFIVEKLTKSVGDKTVFREISFIIHDLDRIGLIRVNGTGKTTLLDVLSGRSGFDGDVSPFSAKSDYTIGYLTQEPDFDDQRRFWIRCYLVICVKCSWFAIMNTWWRITEKRTKARLEKVMAEMDSLNAWEIESQVKTVLSKLGIEDLNARVGDLSGGLASSGATGPSFAVTSLTCSY